MHRIALLLLLFSAQLTAQTTTTDDFSDGDLLSPDWFGDLEKFEVVDGELRLNDESADGPAVLAVRTPVNPEAEELTYEFLVRMDFAPSTSNYCIIRLLEEDDDVDDPEDVITLRFGGRSGSDDALEATFRSGGDVIEGEFTGTAGALGSDPAIARFRLVRGADRFWTLSADYTGGTNFVVQGSTGVPSGIAPDYFEVTCRYTSTRADKFSFDDLLVRSVLNDTEAPTIVAADIDGPGTIVLTYSEPVDVTLAETTDNYSLTPGNITVTEAVAGGATVRLTLSEDLPDGVPVTVTVASSRDGAGNNSPDLTAELLYFRTFNPGPGDLRINEFMADPTPEVRLPETEYVEIFNTSGSRLNLNGLRIASGSTPATVTVPSGFLPAGEYAVIVKPEFAEAFAEAGAQNVFTAALPSLTNSRDSILLLFDDEVLSRIDYTDGWYNDEERDGGGYSVEYTGAGELNCGGLWRASLDDSGGTPGRPNSVTGNPADVTPPQVIGITTDPAGISLTFDELPDNLGLDLFELEGGTLTGLSVEETTVRLSASLETSVAYLLRLLPDFSDCAGNFPAGAETFEIFLPSPVEAGDVIINEILFNPASGGARFVELYNCSDRVFQVEGWRIENRLTESSNNSQAIRTPKFFRPGDYLTFSADPEQTIADFRDVDPDLLIDQTLPSMGDDEGNVTILSATGLELDAFDYNEDLHSELLSPNDGVSLERLRPKFTTQDDGNWFSAASTEGFGTPTRANSQLRDDLVDPEPDGAFSLTSQTFSPDGDGFEDFLEINYRTDGPGFLTRLRIFDVQGRPVYTLARTELLGTTGTLRWTGVTDDGQRARVGAYVILAELFNPNGETREEKLVAVIAGAR